MELSGNRIDKGRGNDVGAARHVLANRIKRVNGRVIRTWHGGHAGSGRGDELLAHRGGPITAKGVVDVAGGRRSGGLTRWEAVCNRQITRAQSRGRGSALVVFFLLGI